MTTSLRHHTPRTLLLDDTERQQIFRACLDALAHPGTIRHVFVERHPAPHLPLLAMTDLMTPVAALGDLDADVAALAGLTRAPIVAPAYARWVLAGTDPDPDALRGLPTGTDADPHLGAMLCLEVAELVAVSGTRRPPGRPGVVLELAGPGVPGTRRVLVDGLSPDVLAVREELNRDYPRGIDLLCTSPEGDLLGLPRTTRITVCDELGTPEGNKEEAS